MLSMRFCAFVRLSCAMNSNIQRSFAASVTASTTGSSLNQTTHSLQNQTPRTSRKRDITALMQNSTNLLNCGSNRACRTKAVGKLNEHTYAPRGNPHARTAAKHPHLRVLSCDPNRITKGTLHGKLLGVY